MFNANEIMAAFFQAQASKVRSTQMAKVQPLTEASALPRVEDPLMPQVRKCRGAKRRGRGRCTKQVWVYA